jgi:hypothetical protein
MPIIPFLDDHFLQCQKCIHWERETFECAYTTKVICSIEHGDEVCPLFYKELTRDDYVMRVKI